jgi:hypothetical protein
MTIDDLDLAYSPVELREFIERAVARTGTRNRPRFYAVTGSHLYGFDATDSDIDLRGFHLTPAEEYAYLERPAGEVTVNMDGVTDGFEAWGDVDLRSYELRQFGSLLEGANYNVVELVLAAPTVMNGLPLEMDALAALVRERLPMNVPHAYLGMARNNYYKHLDPEKAEGYDLGRRSSSTSTAACSARRTSSSTGTSSRTSASCPGRSRGATRSWSRR